MAVVNDHIWLLTFVITDPNTFEATLSLESVSCTKLSALDTCRLNFSPSEGGSEIAVSQHPETKKWQSNLLGEEDSAYIRWHIGKGVPHASYDEVLERRCTANKGRLTLPWGKIPLKDELNRQFYRWDDYVLAYRQI